MQKINKMPNNIERKTYQYKPEGQVNITKELDPRFLIEHSSVQEIIQLTKEFYSPSEVVTSYLISETNELVKKIGSLTEFKGVFLLGFPFYAINKDQKPIRVPEIDSFIEQIGSFAIEDAKQNPSGWKCPSCQKTNQPSNLKEFCQPCNSVILKPRKFFSALPDLDIIVLVEKHDHKTEKEIQEIFITSGYTQSDTDIYESAIKTGRFLKKIKDGIVPIEKIPIDLHIWSKNDLNRSLKKTSLGETDIQIPTRSLRVNWEDNYLNFWFDFIFSLTPRNILDIEIMENITKTRNEILKQFSINEIIKTVGTMSERASRLINCDEVETVLSQRLENWR